tara:strand:+ start:2118 stop:2315 length:198 start_codon:yes stop_codon:yes gene_type:complete
MPINTQSCYIVEIDFDTAQKEWRENKKALGNGVFKYICGYPTKSGGKCSKPPSHNGRCHIHKYKK